jgi:uracil-DNA glycosylase family 4
MSPASQPAATEFMSLNQQIIGCSRCTRLSAYRAEVARIKRPRYQQQEYWGKPVPGWGDEQASLLVLGLAPGAHGANRTGRAFSGDDSGEFLRSAFARVGLITSDDPPPDHWPKNLRGVYITNVVRCAPPGNRPTIHEFQQCMPYLITEYQLLNRPKVVLALGAVAFRAGVSMLESDGVQIPRPRPKFSHGSVTPLGSRFLVSGYHPSRRNTQTGRLTPAMFDSVLQVCMEFIEENYS